MYVIWWIFQESNVAHKYDISFSIFQHEQNNQNCLPFLRQSQMLYSTFKMLIHDVDLET